MRIKRLAVPGRPGSRIRFWSTIAGLALLALPAYHYRERLLHALFPSRTSGQPAAGVEEEASRARRLTSELRGFVVWSSNRFGNHDILMMSLPDWKISRVTSHPHAEYFARVSPDGQRIVFARAQQAAASQRNPDPWDVYMVNLSSGEEKLIARNGNVPTWSEDGRYVYFQRNAYAFVRHELASGTEEVLHEAGRTPVPAGAELQTPAYSARRSAMAVTYRRAVGRIVVVDAQGRETPVGQGCQLNWAPDASFLYWIDHGGLQDNRVYRYDWNLRRAEPWLDLPAPYSHEYFPKLSPDGRFLVLGASSGGHEHDLADYEIFLWRVGTRPEDALRLTYHTGNDNWPDIYLEGR